MEFVDSALASRSIPHETDLWGQDVNDDWPWRRKTVPHYQGRL